MSDTDSGKDPRTSTLSLEAKLDKWTLRYDSPQELGGATRVVGKLVKRLVKQNLSLVEVVKDAEQRAETLVNLIGGQVLEICSTRPKLTIGWTQAEPLLKEFVVLADAYFQQKNALLATREAQSATLSPDSPLQVALVTLDLKQAQQTVQKQAQDLMAMERSMLQAREEADAKVTEAETARVKAAEQLLEMEIKVRESRAMATMVTMRQEQDANELARLRSELEAFEATKADSLAKYQEASDLVKSLSDRNAQLA